MGKPKHRKTSSPESKYSSGSSSCNEQSCSRMSSEGSARNNVAELQSRGGMLNMPLPETERPPSQLSPRLLRIMSAPTVEERQANLKNHFMELCRKGLSPEEDRALKRKYPVPENCRFLIPPKLNKDIARILPQSSRTLDQTIRHKQETSAASISAFGQALTGLLNEKSPAVQPVIEQLKNLPLIMVNDHREDTLLRRELVLDHVCPSLKEALNAVPHGVFLFGDNPYVSETIDFANLIDERVAELKSVKTSVHQAAETEPNA